MEMALVNLVAPGERLLAVSQGYFGDRWIQLAQAFGIEVEALQAEWGDAVPPEDLARRRPKSACGSPEPRACRGRRRQRLKATGMTASTDGCQAGTSLKPSSTTQSKRIP